MLIFAIDPGPREHGWCLVEILPGERPSWHSAGKTDDQSTEREFVRKDVVLVIDRQQGDERRGVDEMVREREEIGRRAGHRHEDD